MKCGYCQYEFELTTAESACGGCPLAPGCHLVRCPRCGYEMPPEPRVIGWLRRWRAGKWSQNLMLEKKESL